MGEKAYLDAYALEIFDLNTHTHTYTHTHTHTHTHTLPATDKKYPMDSFPRGIPAVQFHNCSPSVTDDIEICQSCMTALSSRTSTYVLVHGVLQKL